MVARLVDWNVPLWGAYCRGWSKQGRKRRDEAKDLVGVIAMKNAFSIMCDLFCELLWTPSEDLVVLLI